MKKDIIQGFPNPTIRQIKVFQKNNKRIADGKIGPKTRSAIWRPRIHRGLYTHLIDYPLWQRGAKDDVKVVKAFLRTNPGWLIKLNLTEHAICMLFEILSSEWNTGFSYLSTQDGLTLGLRRLATSTAQDYLKKNKERLRIFFHDDDYRRLLVRRPKDKPRTGSRGSGYLPDANNGFPLDEERMRISFLRMAKNRVHHYAQILEVLDFISELRDQYPHFREGRTIALMLRAANSKRYAYTGHLPEHEGSAYRLLKRRYADTKTHRRRIRRIEKLIKKGEIWTRN